ncbi:MAG: tetratricopeptide repeat protein [Candidatus Korobacteraceae bacterium]
MRNTPHLAGGSHTATRGFQACCATAVAGAVLLLLITSGCIRDPKVRAEKAYERAEKYLREDKTDAAAIELKRALQLDPQLAKAQFALGKIELQRGDTVEAFHRFVDASAADPDNYDAQLMVGELLARARNFTQARRQAGEILNHWTDDKAATLLLAEAEFGLQDFHRAQTLVNQVLASDPNNVRGLQDAALLQMQRNEVQPAQATLRRAWKLGPNSPLAPGILSASYETQGDLQNAESVLKQAYQQNSNTVDFITMLAAFYMRHQRYSDAEPLYRQLQQTSKTKSQYRDVLAMFYLQSKRPKEAQAEYQRLVNADDKDWRSWHGLAITYAIQNRLEDAANILEKVVKHNPRDWQALALEGRVMLDRGMPAQAIPLLQQSHKVRPDSPEPAFELGRAYIATGDLKDAQSALQDVIKVNANYPGALLLLASIDLQRGRVDQAMQELSQDQSRPPNAIDHSFLMGEALAAKGDFESADSQMESLLTNPELAQRKILVLESLSSIKLAQKQYAQAGTIASSALELSPQSSVALFSLGMSYVSQKQPDKALEVVKAHLQKTPNWALGYQVLGQLADQGAKFPEALDAFNHALQIDPNLTSSVVGLGDTYFLMKQLDLARQQYEKAAQQKSSRSYCMARLGQIYELQKNYDKAHVAYENALAADPDNVLAKNNLAWVYAEHGGNIDTALKLAEEAKEKAPDDPSIADTLGWIYLKKGSYEAAIENLKNSVAKNPNDPNGLYHLGTAYFKAGKDADARRELQAALKMPDFPEAAEAKRMLAEMGSK